MADAFYIDASEVKKGAQSFKKLIAALPNQVNDVLNSSALEIEERAHQRLASNQTSYKNQLIRNTKADTSRFLLKTITAHTVYAAFVEFGTGQYAATYVASLPTKYKTFAAQFKDDQGKRSIKGLLFLLTGWFQKKGITDKQHAFFIARSIFLHGTHPHPFLIPSVIDQEPILINELTTLLKNLHV